MWLPSPTNIFLIDMQEQFAVDCPNEPACKGTGLGAEWRIPPQPRRDRDCDAGQPACLACPTGRKPRRSVWGRWLARIPAAPARPSTARPRHRRPIEAPPCIQKKALNTVSALPFQSCGPGPFSRAETTVGISHSALADLSLLSVFVDDCSRQNAARAKTTTYVFLPVRAVSGNHRAPPLSSVRNCD